LRPSAGGRFVEIAISIFAIISDPLKNSKKNEKKVIRKQGLEKWKNGTFPKVT